MASINKTVNTNEYTRVTISGNLSFNDIFNFGKYFSIMYLRINISNPNNKIENKLAIKLIATRKKHSFGLEKRIVFNNWEFSINKFIPNIIK